MTMIANKEAVDAVKDMQNGLHLAMDQLIRQKNAKEAEVILRQLDEVMVRWINQTKEVK